MISRWFRTVAGREGKDLARGVPRTRKQDDGLEMRGLSCINLRLEEEGIASWSGGKREDNSDANEGINHAASPHC